MRLKLELLFLVVTVAVLARFGHRTEPLIHDLEWRSSDLRPWGFALEVQTASGRAAWKAQGSWSGRKVSQYGELSLEEWNAIAGRLLPERPKLHHDPMGAIHGGYSLKIDSDAPIVFADPGTSRIVEEMQSSPFGAIERQMESDAKRRAQSTWATQYYTLKVVPASKVCGFLQGQYKDIEFTTISATRLSAFGPPSELRQIAADIPNLDRISSPP